MMNERLLNSGPTWFSRCRNEIGLFIAILVVLTFTAFINSSYVEFPVRNAETILRETALLGIFALGAGTVILAGGIDLSSGSVIAFSGTIFSSICMLMAPKSGTEPLTDQLAISTLVVAFLVTMLAAFLVGTFHAWLITVIDLPPFVATLASLVGLRSLAKLLIQDVTRIARETRNGKSTINIADENFRMLGNEWWIPVVIFLVLSLALWILLSSTVIGRHLYAMGGNEEAAKLSGIRTDRLKWLAYCIGSMTAAVSGILYTSYIGTAEPTRDGMGYELNAIAASVVGGCSLTGGVGTVAGIMLGSLFLKVVIDSVAKTFQSRPDLVEGLVVGALVVLAVAFNELRGSKGVRKQFFPGAFGVLNLLILTLLGTVVTYVTSSPEAKTTNAAIAVVVILLFTGSRATFEAVLASQKSS